eukprot:UC4_evm1s773
MKDAIPFDAMRNRILHTILPLIPARHREPLVDILYVNTISGTNVSADTFSGALDYASDHSFTRRNGSHISLGDQSLGRIRTRSNVEGSRTQLRSKLSSEVANSFSTDNVSRNRAQTLPGRGAANRVERLVIIDRVSDEGLGFSIRGGKEHSLGIFISSVVSKSIADRKGLKAGDQIVKANGFNIERGITHSDAVKILTSSSRVELVVRGRSFTAISKASTETISWVDVNGKTTMEHPIQKYPISTSTVTIEVGDSGLGISVRGGKEHGIGIFVSGVSPNSRAHLAGLKPGDEILAVNGVSLKNIGHNNAVKYLTCSSHLELVIRKGGLIPQHKIITYNKQEKIYESQRVAKLAAAAAPSIDRTNAANSLGRNAQLSKFDSDSFDDSFKSEMFSRLNKEECNYILAIIGNYRSGRLDVRTFVENLLEALRSPEQVALLGEIRNLVKSTDIKIFDDLVTDVELEALKVIAKSSKPRNNNSLVSPADLLGEKTPAFSTFKGESGEQHIHVHLNTGSQGIVNVPKPEIDKQSTPPPPAPPLPPSDLSISPTPRKGMDIQGNPPIPPRNPKSIGCSTIPTAPQPDYAMTLAPKPLRFTDPATAAKASYENPEPLYAGHPIPPPPKEFQIELDQIRNVPMPQKLINNTSQQQPQLLPPPPPPPVPPLDGVVRLRNRIKDGNSLQKRISRIDDGVVPIETPIGKVQQAKKAVIPLAENQIAAFNSELFGALSNRKPWQGSLRRNGVLPPQDEDSSSAQFTAKNLKSPGDTIRKEVGKQRQRQLDLGSTETDGRLNEQLIPDLSAWNDHIGERKLSTINIEKLGLPLGLTIEGGCDTEEPHLGVRIREIREGGSAARDGRLRDDDEIAAVGPIVILGATHQFAVDTLIASLKGPDPFISITRLRDDL